MLSASTYNVLSAGASNARAYNVLSARAYNAWTMYIQCSVC